VSAEPPIVLPLFVCPTCNTRNRDVPTQSVAGFAIICPACHVVISGPELHAAISRSVRDALDGGGEP